MCSQTWGCWHILSYLLHARTFQPMPQTSGLAIFPLFWPTCVCERTHSFPSGSAGQDGATVPAWEYLVAPLKNLPRFLLDLEIPQSICLDLGFDSSAFRSETTTDSSLLREREKWGSGCVLRVGREKGCLRPLPAWGSCRAGEDDQGSSYFSSPGLLTLSGGPPLLALPCPRSHIPGSPHPTLPQPSPGPSAAVWQNSILPIWLRNLGSS